MSSSSSSGSGGGSSSSRSGSSGSSSSGSSKSSGSVSESSGSSGSSSSGSSGSSGSSSGDCLPATLVLTGWLGADPATLTRGGEPFYDYEHAPSGNVFLYYDAGENQWFAAQPDEAFTWAGPAGDPCAPQGDYVGEGDAPGTLTVANP